MASMPSRNIFGSPSNGSRSGVRSKSARFGRREDEVEDPPRIEPLPDEPDRGPHRRGNQDPDRLGEERPAHDLIRFQALWAHGVFIA